MLLPSPSDWYTQRYRAIAEQQTELVCCYLPDSTLTYVNPAYCRFFALDRSAIIGRRFIDLTPPEGHDDILQHIDWQVKNKTPRVEIQKARKPDGSYWVVEWTDQALLDEAGNVIEILAVGHETTERMRAETTTHQLEIARAELAREREINALRENLLRMVTHELRTPLAIIHMSFDFVMRYSDRLTPHELDERLHVAQAQITHMTGLLDEMVMSISTQRQPILYNPTGIDLSLLIHSIVGEVRQTLGHSHHFTIDIAYDAVDVYIDTLLLHRILINLLTNAIKYSADDTRIDVTAWRELDDLFLSVRDQGIGISPEDQERIFDPFFRADNVGDIPGTGIGLSLVRDCVTAHGGTIVVESAVNQGTRFTIRLPQPAIRRVNETTQALIDWAARQ
jgi:PAS domain S-box-containing protein